MLFDFGFNFHPSVDDIKKDRMRKRLSNCESRIKRIPAGKAFNRELLNLIRTELDLKKSLIEQINSLNN